MFLKSQWDAIIFKNNLYLELIKMKNLLNKFTSNAIFNNSKQKDQSKTKTQSIIKSSQIDINNKNVNSSTFKQPGKPN